MAGHTSGYCLFVLIYNLLIANMIRRLLPASLLLLFLLQGLSGWAQLEKADAFFEIEKYRSALKYYLQAYRKDSTNLYINYRLAKCYQKLNTDRSKSLPYLLKVYQAEGQAHAPEIFYELGIAHFHNLDFEEAVRNFDYYLQFADEKKRRKAERYIEYCFNAEDAYAHPNDSVEFINLGPEINSPNDDYNPFVTRDDTRLIFSSERDQRSVKIFMSKRASFDQSWSTPVSAGKQINASNDQLACGLSPNGDFLFLFFNNFDPQNNDLVISEYNDPEYIESNSDLGQINTGMREEGAYITQNLDTIFFASSRPGGFGGLDLYMSIRLPNDTWGKAINLGPHINTPADENYPNLSEDGQTLHFSSNGHDAIGGYDLFYATWNETENGWRNIKNLGVPINSTYDELSICLLDNQRYAYVAANRPGGFGQLDIYKVVFTNKKPDYFVFKGEIKLQDPADPAKTVALSAKDVELKISVFDQATGEYQGVYSCKRGTAEFLISLPPGQYEWEVISPIEGYNNLLLPVSVLENSYRGVEITKDLILTRKP